jgi:hypothetical protein
VEEIVTETNSYADKSIISEVRPSQLAWKPMTVGEIYGMLWVFMLMGIIQQAYTLIIYHYQKKNTDTMLWSCHNKRPYF